MKRIFLITTLITLIILSSCNKNKIDGIYNPKEKIDKIYVSYTNSSKRLFEDWTWKDKRLKTIDYYSSDGTIASTDRFSYNGERLIQVDNYENNSSMKYRYDHKDRLSEATFTHHGTLLEKYVFEYDDNELSDIKWVIYEEDMALSNGNKMNPLRYMLPELPLESIKNIVKKNSSRDINTIEIKIDIDWEGNNISEIEYDAGDISEKLVFEYDDKKNPFRGFLGLYFEELILEHGNFASKNNVRKIIITEDYKGLTATDTEIVTYTYDGKFPATRNYDGCTEYFKYE